MAITVESENEIYLGGIRFPIKGGVRPALISTLPGKIVIGDYSIVDELIASPWAISDQRGGILVEEMDEKIHQDRCWWSTCDLSYRKHIILPSLAVDCGAGNLSSKDCVLMYQLGADVYACFDEYLRKFDTTNTDFNDVEKTFSYTPTDAIVFKGAVFVAMDTQENLWRRDLVDDMITNADLELWNAAGDIATGWTLEDVAGTGTLAKNGDSAYIHKGSYSAELTVGANGNTKIKQGLPWSDELRGKTIKLTAWGAKSGDTGVIYINDGDGFTESTALGATLAEKTVTKTIAAAATKLEVGFRAAQGDSGSNVVYADYFTIRITSPVPPWVQAKGDKAKYFVEWSDTIYKMENSGQLAYSSDGLNWTKAGKIDSPFTQVNSLGIYQDVNGNSIIYVHTDGGQFAYDYDNYKFYPTALSYPSQLTSGTGIAWWREALYVSAGLDILKQIVSYTTPITLVGLNKDDGLPAEYGGKITKLIKEYNNLFALVDASLASGTGYSGLYAYDGFGWQCKWLSSTADKVAKAALISSAYVKGVIDDYRIYWGCDNTVYYISLPKDIRNPSKVSTLTYAASGVHILPWFDASWVGDKLALTLKVLCKGMSSTETVIVKYRIDHAYTDIDTGWTTLKTIEDDGETEIILGNKAGRVFKSIQFRFDLARSTNTNTPDIEWIKLKYMKLLDTKWGWQVNIDCSEEYNHLSPSQLEDAIKTIVATQTLVDFAFKNTTGDAYNYKVKIANAQGLERTGGDWRSEFYLSLVAP